MKKRLLMSLTLLFLFTGMVLGQTKISGTVVTEGDDEPAIGATIKVQGTTIAAVTDIDGNFTIEVPSGKKLVVSYIGCVEQVVTPSNGMRIVMRSDDKMLKEVVVTGMQKMDTRLFTGATTKVDASKAKLDGVADVSRSLEGRVAGVSVQNVSGTFGTAPKIRVRGATSIYGSSRPLWVVDGVIMEDVTEVSADALSSGDAETLISNAIAGLNADDIESFQILKDGSATSIYGARAMSGVVVVTTKKGKSGQSRINYTGEFTMRLRPSYSQFNIMNSQDQMAVYKELEAAGLISFGRTFRSSSSGVYGKMYHLMNEYDKSNGQFGLANTPEAQAAYLQSAEMRNTNWFQELFSNAISMNHSISMASGTDKAQYYTSFSFMDDPGWTKQSKVKRYTMNVNANYNINKYVSLNLIGNGAYRKQRAPGTLGQSVNVVTGDAGRNFDINPYSYALNTSRTLDPQEFYRRNYSPFNIHHELDNNYMNLDVIDLKFQGELKIKPIRKVEVSLLGSYKYSTTTQAHNVTEYSNQAMAFRAMDDATIRDANSWLYIDPDVPNSLPFSVLPEGGFYRETKYRMNSWDFRATANYNDVYNEDHIVNAFGGMEVSSTDRGRTFFTGVGHLYDFGNISNYDYHYFKQSDEEGSPYYYLTYTYGRDVAFFGTATYSWKGRYTVNGTMRYEGSNRLGKATSARWLPTWNISAAWNAHEEPWFHKTFNNKLSHATLKASYSLTGDKPAVTNATTIYYSSVTWRPNSADQETYIGVSRPANPFLTYEKKHELNIGLDLGFLANRINVAFDWYTRNNYDLIGMHYGTGTDSGDIAKQMNVASMKSNGEELSISTKNIVTKDFQWNTDFIFSHTNTKVTDLKTRTRVIDLIWGGGFTMEGYPYRSLFSMDFQGLNEKGLPTFINENGELTVSDIYFQSNNIDYLKYEGPTDPPITGSLGNSLTYKNWHLNVFMTYAFGNVVRLDPAFYSSYSDLSAMPKEFKNRWVVAGDEAITNIPVIADLRLLQQDSYISYAYNAYNRSTVRVAKGDFIRLKEVSLGYDFPKKWINTIGLTSASAKLQATNLFLIYSDKKLNGQDPEFFNSGGVATPMARQFTFTLRLGL